MVTALCTQHCAYRNDVDQIPPTDRKSPFGRLPWTVNHYVRGSRENLELVDAQDLFYRWIAEVSEDSRQSNLGRKQRLQALIQPVVGLARFRRIGLISCRKLPSLRAS